MTRAARLALIIGLFFGSAGLGASALSLWLTPGVPGGAMNFIDAHAKGQPVHLTLQTVGTIGYGAHPTWVSYLVKDPTTGKWVQDATWKLPAHSIIDMTIYQYDTGSPLRNQKYGQVQGVSNGTASLNGTSFSEYNSNTGNGFGHTFSIPQLGVNVPLVGVSSTEDVCGSAPCTTQYAHNTVTFSFKTLGPGSYYWQCFVPCGVGYFLGNGGPMSTQNYMGGELDVVNVS